MTGGWLSRVGRYLLGIEEENSDPEPITADVVQDWVTSDDFSRGSVLADQVWAWATPGAVVASRALGWEVKPEHLFATSASGAVLGILLSSPPVREKPFMAGLLSRTADLWSDADISADYAIVRDCMLFTINAVREPGDRAAVENALGFWLAFQSHAADATDEQRSAAGRLALEYVTRFWPEQGEGKEGGKGLPHSDWEAAELRARKAARDWAEDHPEEVEELRNRSEVPRGDMSSARNPESSASRHVIQDERRPDGSYLRLDVVLTPAGSLRLEGSDSGPLVKTFMGQEDHEYYREVAAEDVSRVLAELMKERFSSESAFGEWLDARGISSRLEMTW